MTRTLLLLGLLASLAACGDGQPLDVGGGSGPSPTDPDPTDPTDPDPTEPTTEVPAAIAGDVKSATYVPPSGEDPDGSLIVQVTLDTTPVEAAYARNGVLDVGSFRAYTVQEDPLDRFFTALAGQSQDGTLRAVAVSDGGQFNRYFGGSYYERSGDYTPYQPSQPDRGLVSFAGGYAAVSNVDAPGDQLLPAPPGTEPTLLPSQSIRISGDVFLNADFSDNVVNGAIINRIIEDNGLSLEDVILAVSDIEENGAFGGAVETPAQEGLGSYAGLFGGTGATSAAGGVFLEGHLGEGSAEHGIFVLTRCGLVGDSAVCDVVDPQGD